MSDPSLSPASSQNTKKGFSPLAWVGIGCGGIAVIGLIAIVAGGMFVGNKVKQGLADANGNPERFAAEMVVKFNPDMEMLSTDDENGTMTIKMKKTGEEVTISYADIKDGKFSIETKVDGKTTSIKHDGESMKIKDGEGKTTTITAAKKGEYWVNLPEALKDLAYPNVSDIASPLGTAEDDKSIKISSMFITKDAQTKVLEFYQKRLAAGGFQVEDASSLMGKGLKGSKGKNLINITITKDGNSDTAVVFYAELGK